MHFATKFDNNLVSTQECPSDTVESRVPPSHFQYFILHVKKTAHVPNKILPNLKQYL